MKNSWLKIQGRKLLNEQIDYVKDYYYRKWIQDATYREHIKKLKDEELVIHVDYSENYKNKVRSRLDIMGKDNSAFSLLSSIWNNMMTQFARIMPL